MKNTTNNKHAVVIGGSMAGLMAARVLSEHFAQVTVLERDALHNEPESRKGQPHTRHLHGLLARGLELMAHYFPDLIEALPITRIVIAHRPELISRASRCLICEGGKLREIRAAPLRDAG